MIRMRPGRDELMMKRPSLPRTYLTVSVNVSSEIPPLSLLPALFSSLGTIFPFWELLRADLDQSPKVCVDVRNDWAESQPAPGAAFRLRTVKLPASDFLANRG